MIFDNKQLMRAAVMILMKPVAECFNYLKIDMTWFVESYILKQDRLTIYLQHDNEIKGS